MSVITEKGVANRFSKSPSYFEGVRGDFLKLIPSECQKILDIGCGAGLSWRGATQEITGIELNQKAADLARSNMHEVFSGDIEEGLFDLKKSYFDCLIFADVLEHLYDPWGALLKYLEYLRPGGYLLISLPNIQNYRVLRSLIFRGEFSYEESGILDIDHIRFFTRKEILNLMKATGLEVVTLERQFIASPKYVFINRFFFGFFNDFLTGQYYVLGRYQ